jgi:hypothetical protein
VKLLLKEDKTMTEGTVSMEEMGELLEVRGRPDSDPGGYGGVAGGGSDGDHDGGGAA